MIKTDAPKTRIIWLDSLRGITILLVVMHHCFLSANTFSQVNSTLHPFPVLGFINGYLGLFRMPAFFFCSGLLFAIPMKRGWPWFAKSRVLFAVWVISIWTVIGITLEILGLNLYPWSNNDRHPHDAIREFLWSPHGNLWFIYAIAILGMFAMSIRHMPATLQVSIAISISIIMILTRGSYESFSMFRPYYDSLPPGLKTLYYNLGQRGILFFILGVAASGFIRTRASFNHATIMASLSFIAIGAILSFKGLTSSPMIGFLLSIPVTLSSLILFKFIVESFRAIEAPLEFIGKRSLEIFILHQFGIAITFSVLMGMSVPISGNVALLVFFAGSLSFSLIFCKILRKVPYNVFFSTELVSGNMKLRST